MAFSATYPYCVWQQSLSGKAELAYAEYTRKVAAVDAEAEVARALRAAQADKIVSERLGGPEGLRYLWISNQIKYVLPAMVAGQC